MAVISAAADISPAADNIEDSLVIGNGLYGTWTPSTTETQQRRAIFPQGACDYTKPDVGLPPRW